MNKETADNSQGPAVDRRSGCLRTLGVVVITVIIIGLVIGGWVKYNIYASQLTPAMLNQQERTILNEKLSKLAESAQGDSSVPKAGEKDRSAPLEPEAYSEAGAKKEISLSEKELNALIANDPEIARMAAIDLSENLVSLKLVVPIDEDVIILGGKTLRLNMGINLGYEGGQLVVALKGVSLGGIPVPNAWLGYIKNVNLVNEFGGGDGFWDLFAAGVSDINVRDGHLRIRLRE